MVTCEEIPTKVTLSISITNCLGRCQGCHSPELRCNIGTEVTAEEIDRLMTKESGVNCFLFLGEGNDQQALINAAKYVKTKYGVKVALYSGRDSVEEVIWNTFDFVKIGRYVAELGPLNKVTTNQRLYEVTSTERKDITNLFWKNETEKVHTDDNKEN